jgi:hypothetical protein
MSFVSLSVVSSVIALYYIDVRTLSREFYKQSQSQEIKDKISKSMTKYRKASKQLLDSNILYIRKLLKKNKIDIKLEIDRITSILFREKAYIHISSDMYFTIYYINSNKDIITFENDNDVELIETTNLDDIVKYDISNYTIYNGKIYYLLFTEDFLRQKKGISLTHNEALPLIDAFEKAIILHNKESDEFWN